MFVKRSRGGVNPARPALPAQAGARSDWASESIRPRVARSGRLPFRDREPEAREHARHGASEASVRANPKGPDMASKET